MRRITEFLRAAKDWLFTHKLRTAILALVLIFTAPWPARAQLGLDPCCALLAAGLASVQSALTSAVGGGLNQILGVDKSTQVDTKSVVTWTVTFTDGVYTFVCDPHASFMKGSFTVGSARPPPPPPPPAPKCKVPKVVWKKLVTARRMITRARCRVGRVKRAKSRKPRGRVGKQTPRWGVSRAKGTRVNLVVSRGRR